MKNILISDNKFAKSIDIPFLKNEALLFLDSTSMELEWHSDYKQFHLLKDEEILWAANELALFRKGGIQIENFNKYLLQFSSYLTKEGKIKICVGMVHPGFFKEHSDTFLRKNIYYYLLQNTNLEKIKFKMFGFLFEKDSQFDEFQLRLIYR